MNWLVNDGVQTHEIEADYWASNGGRVFFYCDGKVVLACNVAWIEKHVVGDVPDSGDGGEA